MFNQKITVLGGNGMLGTDIINDFSSRGFDVKCYDLPTFNITKTDDLASAVSSADVIINCAAYTNVDGAESNGELAEKINAEAVGRLAALVQETEKYLVHFSTDFVYSGKKSGSYTETDIAQPINKYGESKLNGEQLIKTSGCQSCIVRLEWTYGHNGINFVKKILQRAREFGKCNIVDDQFGAPTATKQISNLVYDIIQDRLTGLYLYAAAGYASRFEVAEYIINELNLDVRLTPCKSSDYPTPAKRPLNSKFDCSKIESALSIHRESWQVDLKTYIKEMT